MAEAPLDIAECLARVRRQDDAAARELIAHLYPQVLKIVRSHLPRRVAEEDLAQEVFMRVFAKLEQFRGEVPFEHWVSRIAVNTCLDQLRAQKARPELRWADLGEDEAAALDATIAQTESATPAEALGARELVEKLLSRLAPADQMVIRLLDLEERSVEEIHQLTGWNRSLIKVRAFRARAKLRKFLAVLSAQERS